MGGIEYLSFLVDQGISNYLCRDKRHVDVEKISENAVYIKLINKRYTA